MRYAVILNNVVINLVEWDGVAPWSGPVGAIVAPAAATTVDINWPWNNGAPVNPNPPPVPSTPIDMSMLDNQPAQLRALALAIAALTNLTVPQLRVAFAASWKQLNPGS